MCGFIRVIGGSDLPRFMQWLRTPVAVGLIYSGRDCHADSGGGSQAAAETLHRPKCANRGFCMQMACLAFIRE